MNSSMSDGADRGAPMTRRRVVGSGAKLAGATIVAGSLGTLGKGFFFPQPNGAAEPSFPNSACVGASVGGSGKGETPRVLVAYASEFGTTGEVAESIGQSLCQQGFDVRVQPVAAVQDLDQYSAVVIGGAIQFDKWMSEATSFVQQHEDFLSQVPVSYFFTCMTLTEESAKAKAKADDYADKVAATSKVTRPLSVGQFAGVLDYARMSFTTLLASKIIYTVLGVKEGDYRDWDAIGTWTQALDLTT